MPGAGGDDRRAAIRSVQPQFVAAIKRVRMSLEPAIPGWSEIRADA